MEKEQNKLPRLDIMIDMETVSNAENAGILSLAFLPFSRHGEEKDGEPFYKVIDLASCYMAGMNMVGCQEWWMQQDPKAVSEIVNAPKKENISAVINEAFSYLSALAEQHEIILWSRGTDYDFPKLEWCIRKFVEKPYPYKYYNKRDVRTWVKETGLDESQFEFEGIKHNALDDCRHQAKLLQASFWQLEPKQAKANEVFTPDVSTVSPTPKVGWRKRIEDKIEKSKPLRPKGIPGSQK